MQLKANAINQADIDQLPLSEVLSNDSNFDLIQASTLSRFIQAVVKPTSNIDESLNKSFEIPKEVSQAYPNLQFHSKIGDSIRYHCVAQSPNEPSFSILIAPTNMQAKSSGNDEGFSDLPDLDADQLDSTQEDGFENIPELENSESKTENRRPVYPQPSHEAEMVKVLGETIGVKVKNLQFIDSHEIVVSELNSGIPILEAFKQATNSEKKLRLVRGMIHLAKESHAQGYSIEGASITDFVVAHDKVSLNNLSVLIPLEGSSTIASNILSKLSPEMAGHIGPRTLGCILYGIGMQIFSLASGACVDDMINTGNPGQFDWISKIQNPSPELGRLLGSLLANAPESRLGLYQEIGVDETWCRLDQMIADWIHSSSRPNILAGGATTIGVYRENNEDAFGIISAQKRGVGHGRHLLLAMVSDGMGGGAVGEIASTLTIESLARSFARANEIISDIGISSLRSLPSGGYTDTGFPDVDPDVHEKAMKDALIIAHYEVKEAADKGGESCGGMGATAVVAHFSEWNAVVGHVGDSRAYLVRDGVIKQITTDHSAVQKLVSMGLITHAEAEKHSRRNELSQAIGGYEEVVPDVSHIKTIPGDKLLLCSDGVTNVLSQDKLLEFLVKTVDPETIAKQILAKVNSLGAPDNATALVIQVN